jgi:hypothetical protein
LPFGGCDDLSQLLFREIALLRVLRFPQVQIPSHPYLSAENQLHHSNDIENRFPAQLVWEYRFSRLLPQGHKIPGHGNVLYYPEDAPDRLVQVYWLNKKMGIPISVLKRSLYLPEGAPSDSSVVRKQPSPLDLIVSWAGVMANMGLVHKPSLDREDLTALLGRLKVMFEKLGVREPRTSSPGP